MTYGGVVGTINASTVTVTTGAATVITTLPQRTVALLLRAATTNTDNITVKLGCFDLFEGNMLLRPGETLSLSIEQIVMIKLLMGQKLTSEDFITSLQSTGAASAPVMYVDALGVS
jgi:hypothetical protein